MASSFKEYYENEWKIKLGLPQYSTLNARWRSRWDFASENIPHNSKVIDVACGDGVLGQFLIKEKKCDVYGIDICDYAMGLAKEKGVKAYYCDMSFDRYPFEDNTFDYAVLACSLEHIINPIHAINETKRILKPGGKLIITLPNAVNIKIRLMFMFGKISIDLLHQKPGEGMHIQFYNYSDEFEERVLSKVDNIKVITKKGDLKNPRKYSSFYRNLQYFLIKLNPNLFAQYTHWIINKN